MALRTLPSRCAFAVLAVLAVSCAPNEAPVDPGDVGALHGPEQIGWQDDPNILVPGASPRLYDNISWDDVGWTFGVEDAKAPYPDTYWPFDQGGIDTEWTWDISPLAKYMAVTNPSLTSAAQSWEYTRHGAGVPGVQSWWGHCPGWTASAMLNPPLLHPVSVRSNGRGGLVRCGPYDRGCMQFEIGDINALEAEVYVDAQMSFLGARCDTSPADIERDWAGRIVRNGSGCQGVNPGALLIVLGQRMRNLGLPVAIDAQTDFTTDEIWNQPAYRYTVYRFEPLTLEQAANLVAYGTPEGDMEWYPWNENARGFALVDLGIHWVAEHGPNFYYIDPTASTRETRVVAVIELDRSVYDWSANIIGGEYLDDPSVGASRLTVAPFMWVATGPGPETLSTSVGTRSHNPYVKPSLVRQLVMMASSPY